MGRAPRRSGLSALDRGGSSVGRNAPRPTLLSALSAIPIPAASMPGSKGTYSGWERQRVHRGRAAPSSAHTCTYRTAEGPCVLMLGARRFAYLAEGAGAGARGDSWCAPYHLRRGRKTAADRPMTREAAPAAVPCAAYSTPSGRGRGVSNGPAALPQRTPTGLVVLEPDWLIDRHRAQGDGILSAPMAGPIGWRPQPPNLHQLRGTVGA